MRPSVWATALLLASCAPRNGSIGVYGRTAPCTPALFGADAWTPERAKFRLPLDHTGEGELPVSPVAVIFFDRDREPGRMDAVSAIDRTYDNHEGTDFMLTGGFGTMDEQRVWAVAAADGIVTSVRQNRPDRCAFDVRAGEVLCNGPDPSELRANHVELCHPDGTVTSYLHLMRDQVVVAPGDRVACGDKLGLVGSSGMSAAPHLHFNVLRERDGRMAYVDPYGARGEESDWVAQGTLQVQLPEARCPGE